MFLNKIIKRERQLRLNSNRSVQFYNFWDEPLDSMYWNRWFLARPELFAQKPDFKVGMFSVFGSRNLINHTHCDANIFYSAENLKGRTCMRYADGFLGEPKIDLSIGFEYFEDERYCRFPNWMDVFFVTQKDIPDVCKKLRFPEISGKNRFASLVCSHDNNGVRTDIMDALSQIGEVACAGKFRHNDDSLVRNFNDDKMLYLRQFCFNICPENSNAMGYVTEKLFQSIMSGCVPVYWGSYNRPEPDVLNLDAVILWNKDGDNSDNIRLVNDLANSPKLMNEFMAQPRLLPTAEEYISYCMNLIEKRISELMK